VNHEDQDQADSQTRELPEFLGSFLFVGGVALLIFALFAKSSNFSIPLPGFWYRNEGLWPFVGIGLSVAGYFLQQSQVTISPSWTPSLPGQRFQRVVIYTKEECHLCDVAKDTLHRFAEWLPDIEEIDIVDSGELSDQYADAIPVIEIDGIERFRGAVNELLLKRLIEGAPPLSESDLATK
jgi:glutaredoxin